MWDCEGSGSEKVLATAKNLIHLQRMHLLIIVEPRVGGDHASQITEKLRFPNHTHAKA